MAGYEKASRLKAGPIIVVTMVVLLTPVLAAINAFVGPAAALPYLAVAAAIALLTLPLSLLVFGGFVLASVVAGLADYFGHVSQGFWIPYLMGALFAFRGIGERIRVRPTALSSASRHNSGSILAFWFAALYLLILVVGTLVALPPLPQLIVATKNYLFLWGLLLALLWSDWRPESSTRFWTIVVVVACLQGPIALYQRFFVAAKRGDAAAWDAVVGTLGGNPESGGHSAAMALLCCLAIAVLLLRMRDRRIGAVSGWLLVLVCMVPIAAAEVKASFIWLAVVFVFFFMRQVVREPVRATVILLVGFSLLVGIGWIYKSTFYERSSSRTFSEIYDQQIKYAFDPNEYRADSKRLGRVTSVVDWWRKHDVAEDPVRMLIGHGAGASRSSSSLGAGELARRLVIQVDVTGASTLLWDLGLLGALAFVGFLLSSALAAFRVSRNASLSAAWRESTYLSSVLLVMLTLGLFYNRDAIDHPAIQMLAFFAVAQVVLARRSLCQVSATQAPRPAVGKLGATPWPAKPSAVN